MKIRVFLYTGLLLLLFACKKDNPPVPVVPPNEPKDTSYIAGSIQSAQQKIVLMEEFTGVYCYTCPQGHAAVSDIVANNPGKVAVLNIHSQFYGIYSNPAVMGNKYDFRTKDADTIVSMLGGIVSVPSGAVDRVMHSGETTIMSYNRDYWGNYAATQLTEIPPVNIDIETDFTADSRKLQIVVELNYTQNLTENNYLSIAIAENNIIDKQFVDTVVVDNYSHQHILRDVITNAKGDLIDVSREAGRVYIRVFNYTLPNEWDTNNIDIIAFVHEGESSWHVLQAAVKIIK